MSTTGRSPATGTTSIRTIRRGVFVQKIASPRPDTGVLNGLVPVTLFGGCDDLPTLPGAKDPVPCLKAIPRGVE